MSSLKRKSSAKRSAAPAKHFSRIFTRGLIVSCQGQPDEPLYGAAFMAAMARTAEMGGAIAIRANSPQDIRAIKRAVTLPIIGLYKIRQPGFEVYITPTFDAVKKVARAGADAIALDATDRSRPGGETLEQLVAYIKQKLRLPVVADVSTLSEALAAEKFGADAVATTLSGYTKYTEKRPFPDIELVRELAKRLTIPVIAEGGFETPEQAAHAIKAGAYAVVVGAAITRPQIITQRFAESIERAVKKS